MLKQTVSIEECLPPQHLARFIVEIICQLNLKSIYREYGAKSGTAIAPEILLGMLIYGYATGVFSSRGLEKASYESIPFRFIAVSHKRLEEIQAKLRVEVEELIKIGEAADGIKVSEGVDIVTEIARREERLTQLDRANQELYNRAQEQYEIDLSKYTEKMLERAAYLERTGKKPSGKVPSPPFLPSVIKLNTISLTLNHES